jgi:hypothetical protein
MEFHHDVLRSGMSLSADRATNSRSMELKYGVSGEQAVQRDLYMAINWIELDCTGSWIVAIARLNGCQKIALRVHEFLARRRIVICTAN